MATKPFIPSSSLLLTMIDRAMAKCAGDVEQVALRKEAQACDRAAKAWTAAVKARRYSVTL